MPSGSDRRRESRERGTVFTSPRRPIPAPLSSTSRSPSLVHLPQHAGCCSQSSCYGVLPPPWPVQDDGGSASARRKEAEVGLAGREREEGALERTCATWSCPCLLFVPKMASRRAEWAWRSAAIASWDELEEVGRSGGRAGKGGRRLVSSYEGHGALQSVSRSLERRAHLFPPNLLSSSESCSLSRKGSWTLLRLIGSRVGALDMLNECRG